MFLPIACLPLVAVLINDVKTERTAGAITVDVATSEPVARKAVSIKSGGVQRMYLYVQGTRSSRESFGSGWESVVAYPRSRYTKLAIPTDTRCGEPLSVEPIPSGIRVRATCRDAAVTAGALPVRVPSTASSGKPLPDAPLAALSRNKAEADTLRAALALPPEANRGDLAAEDGLGDGRPTAAVRAPDIKEPTGATSPTVAALPAENPQAVAAKPVAALPKAETSAHAAQPDAPLAGIASLESPGPASSDHSPGEAKSSSSMVSTLLAAAILIGLAVAAVWFTRRRATRSHMIRIVETASIGPKRSLVVACIGGRTMVLGVSEAGVSLLDTPTMPALSPAAPEKALGFEDAALSLRNLVMGKTHAEEGSSAAAKQDGSMLSRLFHRAESSSEVAPQHRGFDEILSESLASENFDSESLEDQELRRKLASGMAGRVA